MWRTKTLMVDVFLITTPLIVLYIKGTSGFQDWDWPVPGCVGEFQAIAPMGCPWRKGKRHFDWLHVHKAIYGKKINGTCLPCLRDKMYCSADVTNIVKSTCEGEETCLLYARGQELGHPCHDHAGRNWKYCFEMTWECKELCPPGSWGEGCRNKCNPNCKEDKCRSSDGQCLDCKEGFSWPACQEPCPEDDPEICSHKCLKHCVKEGAVPCRGFLRNWQIMGGILPCWEGCLDGYQPPECRYVCPEGTYGSNCRTNCSANCAGTNKACHHVHGKCLHGCDAGYTGPTCEEIETAAAALGSTSVALMGGMAAVCMLAIAGVAGLVVKLLDRVPIGQPPDAKKGKAKQGTAQAESGK